MSRESLWRRRRASTGPSRVAGWSWQVFAGVVFSAAGVNAADGSQNVSPATPVGSAEPVDAGVGTAERAAAPRVKAPELTGPQPSTADLGCHGSSVDVLVTVDRVGAVIEAHAEPIADAGVGERAEALARSLRFAPATRDGNPIAARVTYRFVCPSEPVEAMVEPDPNEPETRAGETRGAPVRESADHSAGVVTAAASLAEAPPMTALPSTESEPHEVMVVGLSQAERLRRGANAVSVVELTSARQRTGSLGEVLARQEGASVRTVGGLGGFTRFSLDGLSGEQVRFFIDGVPLRFAGYSLGVANVPVDQLQHVEIYHGVVPARLGADALGGAVNLSTLGTGDGSFAGAAVSTGSFGTTRLSASATHRDSNDHYLVRANAFRDSSDNNFVVHDVQVVDAQGRISRTSRPHFHNAYLAKGVGLDLGIVDKPWARHLVVRGFYTDHAKEIPHDDVGLDNQNPWGEVSYGRTAAGILILHQASRGNVRLDTRVGFTSEHLRFRDVSRCSYDWFGRCAIERRSRGEVSAFPTDANLSDRFWFARVDGSWLLNPSHELRLALAPTFATRRGRDEVVLEHVPDPLAAARSFFTSVVGADYEVRDEAGAWANNLFGKWYHRYLDASEVLSNGNPRDWDQAKNYGGLGDAFRVNLSESIYTKASYEYAVRFPSLEELFGDGAQLVNNLGLASERSHNVNLEFHGQWAAPEVGEINATMRGSGRLLSDRIWRLAGSGYSVYDNIPHSRVLGVEGTLQWTAPGKWLYLAANGTWLHSRNTSGAEPVPLPSDPWFWANGQATLTHGQVFGPGDSANLDWNVSYVRGFPLSVGLRGDTELRLRVAGQTMHTAAVRYSIEGTTGTFSGAAEMNNVLDARAMDFYGVQRPGRALFLKLSFQVRATPVNKRQ